MEVYENEVREEKDRPEPLKLVCRKVVRFTDVLGGEEEKECPEPINPACRKAVRVTDALGD